MRHAPLLLALLVGLLLPSAVGPAPPADAAASAPTWGWPLHPAPNTVATGFIAPAGPYSAGHRGVDLVATVGSPVLAAGDGAVAFAGPVAGRPVVSVDHGNGLRTTYEPVIASLARGEPLRRGQPLGTVAAASGHCLPAACVHWGLRRGDVYLDPLTLLGAGTVGLLPLWAAGPPAIGILPPSEEAGSMALPTGSRDRGPLLAAG